MYQEKIKLLCDMKQFLNKEGFCEVLTPVLRKDKGLLIPRIALENGQALRDSHELQLRYLLTIYDSVYEIGSCFRNESGDTLNKSAQEFLLMELFSSKHTLEELKELTKEFILMKKPDSIFHEISIAEQIKLQFGIDLFIQKQEILFNRLRENYKTQSFKYDYQYVLYYIEQEIEPLSKGKIVFFTDYPECTTSYAKIKKGDVISRFELFANGLELANGFDDECSPTLFRERNIDLPIFFKEEKVIEECLLNGKLPNHSAGLGIGIERLCMFLYNSDCISDFMFPSVNF